jgi:hypothetical protein
MGRTTGVGAGVARARRWPWALAATVAGAAAGGGVAYAVRRVAGQDRPGAVEPEQLQAVVDRQDDSTGPHL